MLDVRKLITCSRDAQIESDTSFETHTADAHITPTLSTVQLSKLL